MRHKSCASTAGRRCQLEDNFCVCKSHYFFSGKAGILLSVGNSICSILLEDKIEVVITGQNNRKQGYTRNFLCCPCQFPFLKRKIQKNSRWLVFPLFFVYFFPLFCLVDFRWEEIDPQEMIAVYMPSNPPLYLGLDVGLPTKDSPANLQTDHTIYSEQLIQLECHTSRYYFASGNYWMVRWKNQTMTQLYGAMCQIKI